MRVRYSYLPQQFSDPEPILQALREAVRSGKYTLGPEVAEFEKKFASLIGAKESIGVGSGTDALKLSLRAVGVGPGDEVITAANTFIATVGAIAELGAKPVLVDVTPYYTMDPDRIEGAITPRTRAIVPVHLTGEPADMDPIDAIARKHGLKIVEDACQAILAEYGGESGPKRAGTWGTAAGFSLHPLKNLNVWGDAGMITTSDEDLAKRMRRLRNHGLDSRDEVLEFGFNSRLDTLQAIVGLWLLPQVGDITARRRQNAARYDAALGRLAPRVSIPPRRRGVKPVYHLYIFETEEKHRDPLLRFLLESKIDAKVHYPIPLAHQKGLAHLGYKYGDFPRTEAQANRMITLPVDQHLSDAEIDYVIDRVEAYFKRC